MKGIEERKGRWLENTGELRQTLLASLRRWGGLGEAGRREDIGGTVMNVNKGLDAGMGRVRS